MHEELDPPSSNSAVLEGPPTLWTGPARPNPAIPSSYPKVAGYEILDELGRGGMGVVYSARQLALDRVVALKMLLIGPQADLAALTRFWVETQTVAKLRHRNIVQVYDSGNHRDLPFCALELLPGGSLRERMVGEPWKPREAATLVRTLAGAVHVAHAAGVVHRDLKPANVLFDAENQPKITDFGVAKDLLNPACGFTMTGEIVGTPAYMAPEQADGTRKDVGPAADIYALGVILYELLTGHVPFKGSDPLDLLLHVRHSEPLPPRKRVPGVPIDLEVICLKCLEKDTAKRYASADDLAGDLQRFLDGCPIQARPVGEFERAVRWCRRNPLVTSLIAGVVSVFLASFLLGTWSYVRIGKALDEEADQRQKAQMREKAERWERYRANIVAASSSLQLNNVGIMRRLLDDTPDEHRNWEWTLLQQQLDTSTRTWRGNLSADARVAYEKLPDGSFRFWHGFTGAAFPVTVADARDVNELILSPDGSLLAYETKAFDVVVLDAADGRPRARLPGSGRRLGCLRFSNDGARFVTTSATPDSVWTVHVWEVATGRPLLALRGHCGAVSHAAFSRDDRRLVSASDDLTARVWDATTGELLHVLDGHDAAVLDARFSPRGDRIVTANYLYPNKKFHLWDANTGKRIAILDRHTNQLTGFDFSPDGRRLVTSSFDQSIRLWNCDNGDHLHVLQGHTGWVFQASFNNDGTRVLSASQDRTLRVWDPATAATLAVLHGHARDVLRASYSPDQAVILSQGTDGTVRHWDARAAESRAVLRGHANFVYAAAFHPDGQHAASASWDGTARLWHVSTGRCVHVFDHGQTVVSSVALHPDGKRLATVSRDQFVRLWDLASGAMLHRWPLRIDSWRDPRLAFSPDGGQLACSDIDGAVRVFHLLEPDRTTVLKGHKDAIRDVIFSPRGEWLASAGDMHDPVVRIWNVADQTQTRVLSGHKDVVYALAVNRDGSLLASGSHDGTVRLWDTASWTELALLKHGSNTYGLAFSPDGTRLVSGCSDNSIRVWDVQRHAEVAELRGHHAYVHSLAFSPDGTRLVSASGDFTLRVWDTLHANERK
jgi:WD40 repeat protein